MVDDRSDEEREEEERFQRLYGRWEAPSPAKARRFSGGSRGLQRPKDEEDFRSLRPLMVEEDVAWLDDALALAAPEHPWREALGRER